MLLKKIKLYISNDYLKIILLTLFLGIFIFPLANSINFYQNDDWIYYKAISQFLTGNYVIPGYIQALFYTQGVMGTVFANYFGLEKLPVLTFILSIFTLFIFLIITRKYYLNNFKDTALVGLFMLVCPLYMYASLGFMSDMYFLFFLVFGFLFVELFLRTSKWYHFLGFNLLHIIAFFARQLSIVTGFALFLILLLQKKYKWALAQLAANIGILYVYQEILPKTKNAVAHSELLFNNLLNFDYTFSTTYVGLIYATAFIAPITILLVKRVLSNNLKINLIYLSSCIGLFFLFNFLFNPQIPANPNMYFLKNTVDVRGFFYGSSMGYKYALMYETEIYQFFEFISKITLAIFFTSVIFLIRKSLNFYSVFAIMYLGFMAVLDGGLYDRYYLPLIPVTILFILSLESKFNLTIRIISYISLVVITLYSYNFSMDFVILNNHLWEVGKETADMKGFSRNRISAGNAWNRTYYSEKFYKYKFFFETRDNREELKCCFKLYEQYDISYPFNIFVKPKIYLYMRDVAN